MFGAKKIRSVFFLGLVFFLCAFLQETVKAEEGKEPPPGVRPEVQRDVDEFLDLTPEEIEYLRRERAKREAATGRPMEQIKTVTRSVRLDLSPGGPTEKVRVRLRYGASLVFTDRSGNPWPVQTVNEFAADFFEVNSPVEGSAVVNISARQNHREGNVAILLEGLSIPIMLLLDSTQDEVDQRIDMVVPRMGPEKGQTGTGGDSGGMERGSLNLPQFNEHLIDLLIGLAPPNGERLELTLQKDDGQYTPADMEVWRVNDELYLRTPYTLLSPAPSQVQHSADGTRAYVLPISPVLLINDSNNGKIQRVRVAL